MIFSLQHFILRNVGIIVFEKLAKYDLAIDYHKKVLDFDPEYDTERVELMLLYLKLGMEQEAFSEYEYLRAKNSPSIKHMKPLSPPKQ